MEGKPSVDGTGVETVNPGDEAPTEGDWHTLYFLPGIHDIGLNFTIYPVWDSFIYVTSIISCFLNYLKFFDLNFLMVRHKISLTIP